MSWFIVFEAAVKCTRAPNEVWAVSVVVYDTESVNYSLYQSSAGWTHIHTQWSFNYSSSVNTSGLFLTRLTQIKYSEFRGGSWGSVSVSVCSMITHYNNAGMFHSSVSGIQSLILMLIFLQAYFRQGVALQYLGRHADALAAFASGLAQDPKSLQLLVGMVEAAMKSPLRGTFGEFLFLCSVYLLSLSACWTTTTTHRFIHQHVFVSSSETLCVRVEAEWDVASWGNRGVRA